MSVETTSRMEFSYPSEHEDPWYQIFEQLMAQLDAGGYASREDRNIIITSDATMTWDATTGNLTWDDIVRIHAPQTGKYGFLAGSSTYNLPNSGDYLWADLIRAISTNAQITAGTGSQVPNDNDSYVLCQRIGDDLFWRNGAVMLDGYSDTFINLLIGGTTLPSNIVDALLGANSPSSGNVFATLADLGAASALVRESVSFQIPGAPPGVYVTSVPYQPGTLRVYRNGQYSGISGDGDPGTAFVETAPPGGVFTMLAPLPALGESLHVEYIP